MFRSCIVVCWKIPLNSVIIYLYILCRCSEVHRVFETLFNCPDKVKRQVCFIMVILIHLIIRFHVILVQSAAYEEHHSYFFLLLDEACMHCPRVLTQLPLQVYSSLIIHLTDVWRVLL